MLHRFLGIDFGWQGKPSGLASLQWNGESLQLLDLRRETDLAGILAWVDANAGPDAVIGVDAPLVIPNASGMRPADKLAHVKYGKYHAGAYPASQERDYWKRTTELSGRLLERGFLHADRMQPRSTGRFQMEVHPHAATVQLNQLDRIVKYKKGALAERRRGLERLRELILSRLPSLTPRLDLVELPPIPEKGPELKALEDQLDAITCAYVAAYWWYWGPERGEVLGDAALGYMVVPKRLADLRVSYDSEGLVEADLDPSPFAQFEKWFTQARATDMQEPNAMTLATASADGEPAARMVLLKGIECGGFVFYSNYESQKGRELAANPRAALVFYWPELNRQVRITGKVSKVDRDESEIYFHSRPRGSQLGAWTSRQSEVIPDRKVLEVRAAELEAAHEGQTIPLPQNWGGYRLVPRLIEFWQGRPNRLHDRLRYTRQPDDSWQIERLSP